MRAKTERVTRLDYCQYLLVSQINYTLTNYAEHTEKFSHDMANRYLAGDAIRPHLVWENTHSQVVLGSSTLNRGHEHHRVIRALSARDLRPRRLGGDQADSGTRYESNS